MRRVLGLAFVCLLATAGSLSAGGQADVRADDGVVAVAPIERALSGATVDVGGAAAPTNQIGARSGDNGVIAHTTKDRAVT